MLPIKAVLPDIARALADGPHAVVQAPPGAGKSTVVPLALKDAAWLAGRRILMLEPRRLAARAVAHRMAQSLGEPVGRTVGYRIRLETCVGPQTRIEVLTEGILTRRLQHDPALEDTGLVIFDEFHERSLNADLGLAFCLDARALLRPDLRILVMSATMDGAAVAAWLDNAPLITCEGRCHPVATHYLGRREGMTIEADMAARIAMAADAHDGDILAFLPGAGEIRRVHDLLRQNRPDPQWVVSPLFGDLSATDQAAAIGPAAPGRRKIVLATSIAETSLTIEGVTTVIDSGLSRAPRFDVKIGMSRLTTLPVSLASADQRRGRAGRTGPGHCYRLWSAHADQGLPAFNRPEILETDLAALALEMAVWAGADTGRLRFLDPPPAAAVDQAGQLLALLGAIDEHGRATDHGRRMAGLPLHPRLAHMVVKAIETGRGALACDLAALLSEKDVLRPPDRLDPDLGLRLLALEEFREKRRGIGAVDGAACRRVAQVAADLGRRLAVTASRHGHEAAGLLLALAYPDRIGNQRPGGRPGCFALTGGGEAFCDPACFLAAADWIVAAHLDGRRRSARIFLGMACDGEALKQAFGDRIVSDTRIVWDPHRNGVAATVRERLGQLVLSQRPLAKPDPERVAEALLEGIGRVGLGCLPWTKGLRTWQQRVAFVRGLDLGHDFPDVGDLHLAATLDRWLRPYLIGFSGLDDLRRLDLKAALEALLNRDQHRLLAELAPTHLTVASRSRLALDYSGPVPVLAAKVQELFGTAVTPAVAGGRVPVIVHLLSPANRPVQVTRDLAGFWKSSYREVKKQMKGRYPKHHWPDDPLGH